MSIELIADVFIVLCFFGALACFLRRKRCAALILEQEAAKKQLEQTIQAHALHASSKGGVWGMATKEQRMLAEIRSRETCGDSYDVGNHLREIILPDVDAMIREANALVYALNDARKRRGNATLGMIVTIILCIVFIAVRGYQA